MCNLKYQISQFRKPFPDPGSWAYNFAMWKYDRKMGKAVEEDFSIDPADIQALAQAAQDAADAMSYFAQTLAEAGPILKELIEIEKKEDDDAIPDCDTPPFITDPASVYWGHVSDDVLFKYGDVGPINITNIFGIDPDAINGEPDSGTSE